MLFKGNCKKIIIDFLNEEIIINERIIKFSIYDSLK